MNVPDSEYSTEVFITDINTALFVRIVSTWDILFVRIVPTSDLCKPPIEQTECRFSQRYR
jgi:hypothetical protein